ncbi:MAG: histidine phosphatase family protein [Ruminococcaceae bacterium]|nr:histidine phosphatase family protein [Oscillospiraceae bacterium]
MTTIYLMRHGQTAMNRDRLTQGRSDCSLNEEGRCQAVETGERLRELGIRFDRVCSSPLRRARETAVLVSGVDEGDILLEPDIVEMDFGPYEGHPIDGMPPEVFAFFLDPEHVPAPEGLETLDQLRLRTGCFLKRLRSWDPGGTLLVVAHGVVIPVIMNQLPGGESGSAWKRPLKNCDVYRIILHSGRFSEPEKV